MAKEIKLFSGEIAIVDDDDYERLSKFKWHISKGYARRALFIRGTGKTLYFSMHRDVIGDPNGQITDHINGNRLDNRKSNLRFCNSSQNRVNSGKRSNAKTSKYKGLYWESKRKKWNARAGHVFLGRFNSEIEAAKAYNKAIVDIYGEYAKVNIISE